MMRNISFLLFIMALFSCSGDQCGNRLSVYGTYINHSKPQDINYITLNKDGTYYYLYKKKNQKEKIFKGKWKEVVTDEECEVLFYEWKDIVGYMKLDALSTSAVIRRNDKLTFFLDISDSEYEKKE
jgi:hypothetical protein